VGEAARRGAAGQDAIVTRSLGLFRMTASVGPSTLGASRYAMFLPENTFWPPWALAMLTETSYCE
jgi:hypothetical protein